MPQNMFSRNIVDEFFESKKNSNVILDLEELLLSNEENGILLSISTTKDLFSRIFAEGLMSQFIAQSESQKVYKSWLLERYKDFTAHLLNYMLYSNNEIQEAALHTLIAFVQMEAKYPLMAIKNEEWFFPHSLFEKIISALASESVEQHQLILKFQRYTSYDDVKMYLLKAIRNMFQKAQKVSDLFIENCFYLMCSFEYPKQLSSEETPSTTNTLLSQIGVTTKFWLKEKLFRKLFSSVWEKFLRYELPPVLLKKVLIVLHERVLPHLSNPCLFTDFLSDSYNKGGVTGLLSLNGLFFLMQGYNVEYPDFYTKLYGLFNADFINGKFSSRFFSLSDIFLSSTHLPAYIVAAFVKKLSRLSLVSKTNNILKIIPFVCNLLIRHPCLTVLAHRTEFKEISSDPYNFEEIDPAKSGAMESSLWEIKSLQSHVNPDVSRKAKLINNEFPNFELSASATFETSMARIYSKERKRKFSEVPLAIHPNKKVNCILSNKVLA